MEIGTKVGPYRVESLLGKGGMAEVYKVSHGGLGRHEAMKVLPQAMTYDKSFVQRFLAEARRTANLQHPNIAVIHTVSEPECPQPYFTMEIVEDGDLADLIASRGRFSLAEALPILQQIGAALDFAHARGLIHRDVKPGNVLLKKDGAGYVVKLVDFGIAHAQEEAGGTRLTKTGMIVGSAEYMSPEQGGSGAKVDHRSDVYSLGIVAYEMLCGQPPFPGSGDVSVITVIMQHVRDEPPAPITLLPSLPKVANSAILKALAKNPEERFASCAAFLQALAGNVVVGPPRGKKGGASGKSKFPLVPVALGTLVFLGAGLIGYALMPKGPDIEEVSLNPAATTTVAGGTSPTEPSEDSSTEPPTPKVVTVSVPVPIVVSKTEAQASEILKANSLVPQVTTGYSEAFSQGQVMSQYPSVGTEVGKGAPVKIRISLGPNVAEQKRREEAARLREERAEETRAEREAEAADTQAILQAVDAHHDAWERLDVDAYMSGYSTDARIFNNKKWSSYDEHYQHEREMFARGGSIELTRKPASVDINGDRATVSFRSTFQRWGGKGNFKTSGLQKFIMRKVDGRWLIEEDVFKRQK